MHDSCPRARCDGHAAVDRSTPTLFAWGLRLLSLIDPQWRQYPANYTDGGRVAALLAQAEHGDEVNRWYDELHQELCHQYTVSAAAYPAAPHLVQLAKASEELREPLLVLLGVCYAFANAEPPGGIPFTVVQEWHAAAREAIPLVAGLLAQPQQSESELRYLLAALAAVQGCPALGAAIEGLDCSS
jgi:hypothetical protein